MRDILHMGLYQLLELDKIPDSAAVNESVRLARKYGPAGCEKLVNKRLLESYSLAFARFIQCEEALSTYGLLGKHPTTGGVVASPFASLSQSYQKQANVLWYEIFDIVKQNCTTKFDGSPQDDLMEQLLRSRK